MLVVLLVVVVPWSAAVEAGRRDPATSRVRMLYIGDGWGPSPVAKFQVDPAFTVLSVPTSEFHSGVISYDREAMKRFVRLYMPKTFEALVENNDLLVLSDASVILMGHDHFTWFRECVQEHGLGLIMVGGFESFGAPRGQPWTPIEDMMPVNFIMGSWVYTSFKARPATEHEFISALPWRSMPYFHGLNKVSLKHSATLLLRADEVRYPPLSFIESGEGRTVAHASDWSPGAGADVMKWEYYPDYVANIAFLATRNDIPQDAELLHDLRLSFWSTTSRLTIVVDTLNFADRFGANTRKVEDELGKVREMISEAEGLYIEQSYQQSREKIDGIDGLILELQMDAIDLKDQALLWVYITEWSVTTGAALLAGWVLWSLMVKRRLYREVGSTRTGPGRVR
jgi:uncharacterized membrane protein